MRDYCMPKRDIPVNADEDTRFALIMEGLREPTTGRLKPPKIVSCEGSAAKWEHVGEKPISVTDGYLVKKRASPDTRKALHTWLFKTSLSNPNNIKKYFCASFCETVGSELFRYSLGELAPKNRLATGNDNIPGLVSRYLPDFVPFSQVFSCFDYTSEKKEEKIITTLEDQGITGIHQVIAANCFFNDYDGKFGNTGILRSMDGQIKVGRIDFGTAFSRLFNHKEGIATYLFNKGKYSYRYSYAKKYAPLLQSELFRESIHSMSEINMDHVERIVIDSIERFCDAWRQIPIDSAAIEKLFSHLYGEDKNKWCACGFQEDPTVRIDFVQFNQVVCDDIIHALTERKKVFKFFSIALACQNDLNAFSEADISELLPSTREIESTTIALINEARDDISGHKRLLLSWLTKDKLQFTPDGRLTVKDITESTQIQVEPNAMKTGSTLFKLG